MPHRLADFLRSHRDAILEAWEAEVRQLPAARALSQVALRDHLPLLLKAIADMVAQAAPAHVEDALGSVPDVHALERLGEGFDLQQVVREYRLLRRCVLRLWAAQGISDSSEATAVFHDAVDEAVGASVSRYMRARERTFQALDSISAAAIGSPDVSTFLPRLLQVLQETVQVVDAVAVLVCEGEELRVESAVGLRVEKNLRLRVGEGLAGEVAATRQPLLVHEPATGPRRLAPVLLENGLRAVYGVPLLLEGTLLGVALMGSRTSQEFSGEDLLLFRTMAARTTSMLARAQAHAREQAARAESEQSRVQLRASEERRKRWEEIFTHLGVGVVLIRVQDGLLEDVNPAFARMHGFTREELVGRPLEDTCAPESRGALSRHMQVADSKPHHEYESLHLRKDGSRFPVLTHVTSFRDEAGHVVQRACAFLDITQRRAAEAERQRLLAGMEAERARLAAVLDQLPAGVILAEAPQGRQVLGNRQVERLLGAPFTPAESLSEYGAYVGFHPDGRPYLPEEWPLARSLLQGEVVEGEELDMQRADGTRLSVLASSSPIRSREGTILAGVLAFVDVTPLRRAEAAARQAAEFGEKLMGIVSHDLRNPLNAIHLSVTQLLHSEALPPREQRAAVRISKAGERMKRMIEELLDFTRGRLGGGIPIHRTPGDLRAVVRQGVEELEAAWPERQVLLQVEPGRYEGEWDAGRWVQVVSNLGGNALQYSPPEAPVTFRLTDTGDTVVLEVHNLGAPIPPEALPHLFDPFRRAVSQGNGLGLGLYIVEQVVKGHQGHLSVTSTAQEGTTFRVRVPRRGAVAPPEVPAGPT
ncbi:PAS domain S-box protein [Stigmatella aurantiaca]|uniref:histidine kinase n=1 Tax=Stigmatella aurantiaca (strain DW4/3-1) TaxID=378806 RepID=Q091Q8_STIAD|nr:PAS domain S-box protein [Stigmatella aurantiaca]ADO68643.1 Sensor protein [Stigmatella aurantiaca DW4/3-1]EAU66452.1 sensor histidine kinase [Stigmatella aurantiaca DW4/3-1]